VEPVQIDLDYHWSHGVAAVIEFPSRVTNVRHNTFGTDLRQLAGTENWLHLSIPAVNTFNVQGPLLYGAVFRGLTNENARVDTIKLSRPGADLRIESVTFVDTQIEHVVKLPDASNLPPIRQALLLSVHVAFLSGEPQGRLIFDSGAAIFGTVIG
jgi:hypothetical protein